MKDGTGAKYLLGHVEDTLGSKWECFSKHWFPFFYQVTEKRALQLIFGFLTMLGRTTFNLTDLFKDIQYLFILVPLLPHSMPLIAVGALSLVISEALKIVHLSSQPGVGAVKRVAYCFLTPLMHIWIHHKEFIFNRRLSQLASIQSLTREEHIAMKEVRKEAEKNQMCKGELRATENVTEHFIQIILSLSAMQVKGYGDSLKIWDKKFIFVLACLFLLSIIRGQVNLISYQKRGFLGIWAKLLLVAYVIVAAIPRGVLAFYTFTSGTTQ